MVRRLAQFYPALPAHRPTDPLDELVGTILSQNTSDRNSAAAFRSLRSAFRGWHSVIAADVSQIAEAIRPGGLHRIKARRILNTLQAIEGLTGRLDLNWLRDLPQPGSPPASRCHSWRRRQDRRLRRSLFPRPAGLSGRHPRQPDLPEARTGSGKGVAGESAGDPRKRNSPRRAAGPAPQDDPIGPRGLPRPQSELSGLSLENSLRLLCIANGQLGTKARAPNYCDIRQKMAAGSADHCPVRPRRHPDRFLRRQGRGPR